MRIHFDELTKAEVETLERQFKRATVFADTPAAVTARLFNSTAPIALQAAARKGRILRPIEGIGSFGPARIVSNPVGPDGEAWLVPTPAGAPGDLLTRVFSRVSFTPGRQEGKTLKIEHSLAEGWREATRGLPASMVYCSARVTVDAAELKLELRDSADPEELAALEEHLETADAALVCRIEQLYTDEEDPRGQIEGARVQANAAALKIEIPASATVAELEAVRDKLYCGLAAIRERRGQ